MSHQKPISNHVIYMKNDKPELREDKSISIFNNIICVYIHLFIHQYAPINTYWYFEIKF